MVQVDVFWSYGLGATLAVAASRQVMARQRERISRWRDPYLMKTLLFLALVFAPSGIYLLWEFPSWETMHVGDRDMPAWLVAMFAITNVTQGILGFWVVERLLAKGRSYLAYLQIVVAYLGMFFILVHGWDGKGYQRFFSPTHEDFLAWDGDWSAWLTSDVALTLLGMGVILVPLLMWATVSFQKEGYRLAPDRALRRPGAATIVALSLATVLLASLGLAVLASLLIHALGTALGVPAAIALVVLALVPGGPVHALYRAYGLPDREELARSLRGTDVLAQPAHEREGAVELGADAPAGLRTVQPGS